MNVIRVLFCVVSLCLAGCSTLSGPSPDLLAKTEKQCAHYTNKALCEEVYTSYYNGLISKRPHPKAVTDNDNIFLKSDGYIVSFDKSAEAKFTLCNPPNQKRLFSVVVPTPKDFQGCVLRGSKGDEINFEKTHLEASATYRDRIRKTLETQSKNIFLTSIISYETPPEVSETIGEPEALFSLTDNPCSKAWAVNESNDQVFIDCSFEALNDLETSLTQRLAVSDYSHIILVSTGWNTVPSDSVENYNEIIASISAVATGESAEFKPLVIGLTWPSRWLGTRLFSYSGKGNDADEIGVTWANYLMNKVIPQALIDSGKRDVKTVVIGHSFGARLLSTATISGDFVETGLADMSPDVLFLMQSAFSARRFHDARGAGHKQFLIDLESRVDQAALTASSGDWLVRIALHVDGGRGHVSSGPAWKNICINRRADDKWKERFDCRYATQFLKESAPADSKILYIKMDGDQEIDHGGVWGDETAKLIWKLIKS